VFNIQNITKPINGAVYYNMKHLLTEYMRLRRLKLMPTLNYSSFVHGMNDNTLTEHF
jgi:hypothetical protein